MSAPAKGQIFLGPSATGGPNGGTNWLTGANGGGVTLIDLDDPGAGGFDFTISNTVAGQKNNGDWRCMPFSLGPAAGGARPITFSFAYKLANNVAPGNNIHLQLRFFDATGTKFLSETVIRLGAHSRDSTMTNYHTRIIEGILAPREARTADIWFNANIFEPWVSGAARFNNFSVTTAPRSLLFKIGVGAAIMLGLAVLIRLFIQLSRRRAT